jgi:hypothetical protein
MALWTAQPLWGGEKKGLGGSLPPFMAEHSYHTNYGLGFIVDNANRIRESLIYFIRMDFTSLCKLICLYIKLFYFPLR